MPPPRDRVLARTRQWAEHRDLTDVGTTSSFANMEALLRREYHGRFVIELVQNARDAWYAGGRPREERGTVRVMLHGSPPVLTVANQGEALDVDGLFKHLCQFGESSKRAGTGIGHKGIGFKSVLEITPRPELLSRSAAAGAFELRVRFDRRLTEPLIGEASGGKSWEQLVSAYDPKGLRDKHARLPVLRFPHWLDELPEGLDEEAKLGALGFNTLVRLPFDNAAGLTSADWLEVVRTAMDGLSEEILVLLDAFEQVHVEDRLEPSRSRRLHIDKHLVRELAHGGEVRRVELSEGGTPTGCWLLYERKVPSEGELAGELVVGVRLSGEEGAWTAELPSEAARAFHLFFPTRIASGLPLLLHAYFEVDAGRTRFAPDAETRNRRLLEALAGLVGDAVADLVADHSVATGHLVRLFSEAGAPGDDPLAREFHTAVLGRLDVVPWIPDSEGEACRPGELLVEELDELQRLLPRAFPAPYLRAQVGRRHLAEELASDLGVRRFLVARGGPGLSSVEGPLATLLRPTRNPWPGEEDQGFKSLVAMLAQLGLLDSGRMEGELKGLRGEPSAALVPVVEGEGGRRLVHPPGEERGRRALFARVGSEEKVRSQLGVPTCLNRLAFVPDGVLDPESLAGVGAALGIRAFGTDSVLDVLPERSWDDEEAPEVLGFVWRLLLRESLSRYSVKGALGSRRRFQPGQNYWADPRLLQDTQDRRELVRRQALSRIPLPTRNGRWAPATDLCFGPRWASSAGESDPLVLQAGRIRTEAYADLEQLAPSSLVADPELLAELLPLRDEDLAWLQGETLGSLRLGGDATSLAELSAEARERLHLALLHVFLLRLGVWEAPPLRSVVADFRPEASELDPWGTEGAVWTHHALEEELRSHFGVSYRHSNPRIGMDHRLAWTFWDDPRFARALDRGAELYRRCLNAPLFCTRCGMHIYRIWAPNAPESSLARQLTRNPWVPVTVDAQPAAPRRPAQTWWMESPPDDPSRIATNPRRFLPLVRRGLGAELLVALGAHRLEGASPEELGQLLGRLKLDHKAHALPIDMKAASARQAFFGLHRMLYLFLARSGAAAREVLERHGVLTRSGSALVWSPPEQALFDDGQFSQLRRHFVGRVCFSPLRVGDEEAARVLGLPAFRVQSRMEPVAGKENQSHIVADFLDEQRLAELMSLLVHVSLGGRTLDSHGADFRTRSQRLRALEVYRVPDVVLTHWVEVAGQHVEVIVGEGADKDHYLDWSGGKSALLYHDFQGEEWFRDHVRRRLGEVVSRLVENPSFQDTFTLFFQEEGEGRAIFLAERGITTRGLDEVKAALGRAGLVSEEKARRWWTAVATICGVSAEGLQAEDGGRELASRLEANGWGEPEVRLTLAEGDAAERVRREHGPNSVLAGLEACGVELSRLHEELQTLGDAGLGPGPGNHALRHWKAEHGYKVAWLIAEFGGEGVGRTQALELHAAWELPERWRFACVVPMDQVLQHPLEALAGLGIQLQADELSGERIDFVLAEHAGLPLEDWDLRWREILSPEDRARTLRRRALAWREALELPAVALLSSIGDLPHQIRARREAYLASVPAKVDRPDALREPLEMFIADRGASGRAAPLLELLPSGDSLAVPDAQDLLELLELPEELLTEVRAALKRRGRDRLDKLRKAMDTLRENGVEPRPHRGSPSRALKSVSGAGRKRVRVGKVQKKDTGRIGAQGEAWALAAVLTPLEGLLATDEAAFCTAVEALNQLLQASWEGPAVEALLPKAERALDPALDHEERLQALASFLHLSETSDGFGCDLLGWLPPYQDEEPRALAIEVKSTTGRRFFVSEHEWRVAEDIEDDYAFLVVLRKGREARAMELLPHPEAMRVAKPPRLDRTTDTWRVSYTG